MKIEDFCIPENLLSINEYHSPSGKYSLLVSTYKTKEGCWNCTKGDVIYYGDVIFSIYRNYSNFPFMFVEDHPNNTDYLVCSESYTTSTVVDLKSRNVNRCAYDSMFCPRSWKISPNKQTIVVNGCYWACEDQIKIFDFTNPMEPWYQIGLSESIPNSRGYSFVSEFLDDDTIVCSSQELEYAVPLGRFIDDLSQEELEEYENKYGCSEESDNKNIIYKSKIDEHVKWRVSARTLVDERMKECFWQLKCNVIPKTYSLEKSIDGLDNPSEYRNSETYKEYLQLKQKLEEKKTKG